MTMEMVRRLSLRKCSCSPLVNTPTSMGTTILAKETQMARNLEAQVEILTYREAPKTPTVVASSTDVEETRRTGRTTIGSVPRVLTTPITTQTVLKSPHKSPAVVVRDLFSNRRTTFTHHQTVVPEETLESVTMLE